MRFQIWLRQQQSDKPDLPSFGRPGCKERSIDYHEEDRIVVFRAGRSVDCGASTETDLGALEIAPVEMPEGIQLPDDFNSPCRGI